MFGDFLELFWPRGGSELLDRRRAEAIAQRVRAFGNLFAVLTIGWSAVDAVAFEGSVALRLIIVRLVAGVAFLGLAQCCRERPSGLRPALTRLAALFVIPALTYAASIQILADVPHTGLPATAASLYAFVPFVLAAGVGAFPLAAVEAAALVMVALLAEGWGHAPMPAARQSFALLDAFWQLMLLGVVGTFAAMSQLRLLEELARQAMRDPLTGCHRRESGKEFLEMQFLIAARHAAPLAVLFADLDRFKAVNDQFGHDEGDRVLAAAAEALRHMTRESDIVLRWGGEEFVVVLPHTTLDEAVALLHRLREHGLGRRPDGQPLTVSVGIAEYKADGVRSADELVELADRRMYRAKQAGRNRYVLGPGAEASTLLEEPTSTA